MLQFASKRQQGLSTSASVGIHCWVYRGVGTAHRAWFRYSRVASDGMGCGSDGVVFISSTKICIVIVSKMYCKVGSVWVLLCLHWIFFYASIKASIIFIDVVCFSLVGFFTALFELIINKHRFYIIEFLFSILTVFGVYLIFHFDTRYRLGIAFGIISSALYALFAIANQHVMKRYEAKNILF